MTRDCFDAAKEDVDILFALGLVIVEIGASRFNVLTAVSELRMGVISLIAIIWKKKEEKKYEGRKKEEKRVR